MTVRLGKMTPDAEGASVVGDGEFSTFRLSDVTSAGHWCVLFFYPLDFTFVCPTEIRGFNDRAADFEAVNCKLAAVSIDSKFSHLAWLQSGTLVPDSHMNFPLVSDLTHQISLDWGVLSDAGFANRGTFVIDPAGILRYYEMVDSPVGRSVEETLRIVQALQHVDSNPGHVCPMGWTPGSSDITVG